MTFYALELHSEHFNIKKTRKLAEQSISFEKLGDTRKIWLSDLYAFCVFYVE